MNAMTAIIAFFINGGQKLLVAADRKIAIPESQSYRADKFDKVGRHYFFYAGDVDFHKYVITELRKEKMLTLQKIIQIIGTTSSRKYPCDWIVIDIADISKSILIQDGLNIQLKSDIEVIGSGRSTDRLVQKVILEDFNPRGISCRQLKWGLVFIDKFLQIFHEYSYLDPAIGHPALFGLDIFIFDKSKKNRHKRIRIKYDVENKGSYRW